MTLWDECIRWDILSTNYTLLPTKWWFCCISEIQSLKTIALISKIKTVNFHVTTVVNKDSFLCDREYKRNLTPYYVTNASVLCSIDGV